MRVLCIYFPHLAMHVADERLRLAGQVLPKVRGVCVVAAPAQPSPATTKPIPPTLSANMRIGSLSDEAQRLGLHCGQTVARAKARVGEIAITVVTETELRSELERIAEAMFAFGAQVGIAESAVSGAAKSVSPAADGCIWIDVSGCAALHDPDPFRGEELIAFKVHRALRLQGHQVQLALAEGPRVAAMLARAAEGQPLVVPRGENYHALAQLSVTALPLPDATLRMLQQVGIATIGQLRALPAASLALRLGSAAVRVMGLLRGDDCAPLQPYVPPEQPCERVDLERETCNIELLSFVLKSICDRLAQRLEGRGLGATSIELTLRLDRGIAPDSADVVHVFELSTPVHAADVLLALLRARLAKLTLVAPVKSVSCTLRALVAVASHSGTLFSIQRRALGALDKVLAELEGELGAGNVGQLSVDNSWTLAARSKLLPWGVRPALRAIEQDHEFAVLNVIEPTRLLACPTRIAEPVQALRLVVRHEATAWWSGNATGVSELLFAYWNHQAVLVEKSQRGTFLVGYVD
jgi:hypothetical protein